MKPFSLIPKRFRYLVISIMTAVAIVIAGLVLKVTVLKISAPPVDALNDTRSPVAEERRQADVPTPTLAPTPKPTPTVVYAPPTEAEIAAGTAPAGGGTDSTYALPSGSAAGSSASSASSAPSEATAIALSSAADNFGHLPYSEDDAARLESAGTFSREGFERSEALDYEAAQAFADMQAAAEAQGVKLMPISGFRSVGDQKTLFNNQIERKGSIEAAAQYSAPPGHSEHHTGYAVDIADSAQPEEDLKHSFEMTSAYQWLSVNARTYHFEQSFPKNNKQGVSFEPWHWRYVGSQRAEQTFAIARALYPS
jgi:zinc D-Ala-D-Ala carboxypeptidase